MWLLAAVTNHAAWKGRKASGTSVETRWSHRGSLISVWRRPGPSLLGPGYWSKPVDHPRAFLPMGGSARTRGSG